MNINTSDELRKLILQQAERYNIPLTHICNKVNIQYRDFLKKYVNIKELEKGRALPDDKLIEIANIVGIDVRVLFVIKNDYAEEALKVKQKLKDEFDDRKEKRSNTKA